MAFIIFQSQFSNFRFKFSKFLNEFKFPVPNCQVNNAVAEGREMWGLWMC